MMLTSILSSDFSVVVNLAFRKGEPVDRHRRESGYCDYIWVPSSSKSFKSAAENLFSVKQRQLKE